MSKCKKTVEALVSDYEKVLNRSIIKKTDDLFLIVSEFIIQNELILYGGFALNLLLPKKSKIYDDTSLNDFDCFSKNAKQMATKLSNLIANKGFKYIEVKPGIHPGTWKVFVEFISVCDITELQPDVFDHMYRLAKFEDATIPRNTNFLISPITFLKKELCVELAEPATSYYRWEKLLKRFHIFMNAFPDKPTKKLKSIYDGNNADLNKLLNSMIKIAVKDETMFVGNIAIDILKDSFDPNSLKSYGPDNPFIEILAIDPKDIIQKIKSIAPVTVTKIDGFTTHLSYKDNKIMGIYDATVGCYSYCKKGTYRIGTMFTLLYILFNDYIRREMTYNEDLKHNINRLMLLLKKMKCKDQCFLNTNCYGKILGIRQIRKDSWEKRLSKYRPRTTKVSSLFDTEIHT